MGIIRSIEIKDGEHGYSLSGRRSDSFSDKSQVAEEQEEMYIHTFGRPGDPVILLLHPMGITGTALYDIISKYIPDRNSYFVISPDQGGHGSGGSYLSKAEEVNHLVGWLHDNNCMHIHFMFGASMGAALAYELIKKPELTFDKVWLDGASFSDDAKIFCLFFTVS